MTVMAWNVSPEQKKKDKQPAGTRKGHHPAAKNADALSIRGHGVVGEFFATCRRSALGSGDLTRGFLSDRVEDGMIYRAVYIFREFLTSLSLKISG